MVPECFADRVLISAWNDPVVAEMGHAASSLYAEWFWLPVIGPSSLWLIRRISDAIDDHPEGFDLDTNECAAALGLGNGSGRNSAMQRTLRRIVQFGLARTANAHSLAVRQQLPPLNRMQVARLPASLVVAHHEWIQRELERHRRQLAIGSAISEPA